MTKKTRPIERVLWRWFRWHILNRPETKMERAVRFMYISGSLCGGNKGTGFNRDLLPNPPCR